MSYLSRYIRIWVPDHALVPVAPPGAAEAPHAVQCFALASDGLPEATASTLAALCNDDEHQRAGRYRFDRDRMLSLLARGLLRWSLSRFTGDGDPRRWIFLRDAHGRPFLDGSGGDGLPDFNVSHCEGQVVCIVGRGGRCGIDVEAIIADRDYRRIARHVLVRAEEAWVRNGPPEAENERFLRVWTAKEAIAKAVGLGLGMAFDEMEVRIDRAPVLIRAPSQDVGTFSIWQTKLYSGHVMSIATLGIPFSDLWQTHRRCPA